MWMTKKIIHSRLPKATLIDIFLPFYLTEKHQICILCKKTFIKKSHIKGLCKKLFENRLCGILNRDKRIISAFTKTP